MKPVGERSAGNPHAAFDERGWETGQSPPRPSSTLLSVATASPEPETAPDQRGQDRQYYRDLLHDLLALGAGVGRMIGRQTEADETAHTEPTRQEERPARVR